MMVLVLLTLAIRMRVEHVIIPATYSRDSFNVDIPQWVQGKPSDFWDMGSITRLLTPYNISSSYEDHFNQSLVAVLPSESYDTCVRRLPVLVGQCYGLVNAELARFRATPEALTTENPVSTYVSMQGTFTVIQNIYSAEHIAHVRGVSLVVTFCRYC